MLLEPTPAFYEQEDDKKQGLDFSYLLKYLWSYKKLLVQLAIGLLVGSGLQFRGIAGAGFGNGLANLGLDLGFSSLRGRARGAISNGLMGDNVRDGFRNGAEGGLIQSAITNACYGRPRLLGEKEKEGVKKLIIEWKVVMNLAIKSLL